MEFENDVKYAVSDPIKKRNYETVIRNFNVKKFDAEEQSLGLDYYDFICELNDGTKLKFEFKNRRIGNIFGDIALEVFHDVKTSFGGCIFQLKKNDVDYFIYTWHEKPKKGYLILKADLLEEWWRENYSKYFQRKNGITFDGGRYRNQSSWCAVPIKDIPKEIIFKYEIFPNLQDFWSGK